MQAGAEITYCPPGRRAAQRCAGAHSVTATQQPRPEELDHVTLVAAGVGIWIGEIVGDAGPTGANFNSRVGVLIVLDFRRGSVRGGSGVPGMCSGSRVETAADAAHRAGVVARGSCGADW